MQHWERQQTEREGQTLMQSFSTPHPFYPLFQFNHSLTISHSLLLTHTAIHTHNLSLSLTHTQSLSHTHIQRYTHKICLSLSLSHAQTLNLCCQLFCPSSIPSKPIASCSDPYLVQSQSPHSSSCLQVTNVSTKTSCLYNNTVQ